MLIAVPMPLKQLQSTHSEYDSAMLETMADFYEGGKRFEENKGKYLRPRGADNVDAWKKARLACSYYTPHLSGKIDGLIGGILRNPPKINIEKSNDPRASYWLSLNRDVDGCGRDLSAIVRNALIQTMLPSRAYLCICTPEIEAIEGESMEEAKNRKRVDCYIRSLNAIEVDDWEFNADGSLEWIRTYCITKSRTNGIGPVNRETHIWRYYEKDAVTSYEASREIKDGTPENWPDGLVVQPNRKNHGLGVIPIIPIEVPDGFNLGGRLLPIAKALYCRECALTYHLDNAAYAVPVVNTDKPIDQVFLNELNMLNPGLNGRVSIVEFSGITAASLTADCAKLKNDLDSAMQALADQARDRVSGVAQQQFREPKEILMSLFAMPIVDALEKAVKAIADYRGEVGLGVSITGLDEFDTQSTELIIASMTQLLNLPEMPATARQIAYKLVIDSALPVKQEKDVIAISNELKEIKGPSPVLIQANNKNAGESVNIKTGAPEGMGADQIRQSNVVR